MLRAVRIDAIGVNLRSGYAHMDLDGGAALSVVDRAAQDGNVTSRNSIVRALQPLAEFASPRLQRAGPFYASECESQRRRHVLPPAKQCSRAIVHNTGRSPYRYFHVPQCGNSGLAVQAHLQFDEMRHRAGAHLLHHLRPMNLDGSLAQVQVDGNDLVGGPVHHHRHDLPLARSQRFEPADDFGAARQRGAVLRILLQGVVDPIQEVLVPEGLLDELEGALPSWPAPPWEHRRGR